MLLNLTVLALFLIGFIWRATDHLELDKTRWGQEGFRPTPGTT
jgi:hypothetical protein